MNIYLFIYSRGRLLVRRRNVQQPRADMEKRRKPLGHLGQWCVKKLAVAGTPSKEVGPVSLWLLLLSQVPRLPLLAYHKALTMHKPVDATRHR